MVAEGGEGPDNFKLNCKNNFGQLCSGGVIIIKTRPFVFSAWPTVCSGQIERIKLDPDEGRGTEGRLTMQPSANNFPMQRTFECCILPVKSRGLAKSQFQFGREGGMSGRVQLPTDPAIPITLLGVGSVTCHSVFARVKKCSR